MGSIDAASLGDKPALSSDHNSAQIWGFLPVHVQQTLRSVASSSSPGSVEATTGFRARIAAMEEVRMWDVLIKLVMALRVVLLHQSTDGASPVIVCLCADLEAY